MRKTRWIVALTSASLLPAFAFGQSQPGVIRVHVAVPGTQTPIAGVQLSLQESGTLLDLPDNEADLLEYLRGLAAARAAQPSIRPVPSPTTVSAVMARAVTDLDGNAVFENLKPGRYTVGATREGYVSAPSAAIAGATPSPMTSASTAMVVEVQPSAVNVQMSLNPGATISGFVRSASGTPISNARVTLGTKAPATRAFLASGVFVHTDINGEYRLPLVGPGEYSLRVQMTTFGTPEVTLYYPGTREIERATTFTIESPRSSVEAGRNIANVNIIIP